MKNQKETVNINGVDAVDDFFIIFPLVEALKIKGLNLGFGEDRGVKIEASTLIREKGRIVRLDINKSNLFNNATFLSIK